MSDYELEFSFGIDKNELAGIPSNQVFVLGYEFCQFVNLIDSGGKVETTVRLENLSRCVRYMQKEGRSFRHMFSHEDQSESWVHLIAEAV